MSARTVRDLRTGESAVLGDPTIEEPQRSRLAELGLRAGEQVTLTQRAVGGARIIAVHGSRIAIDARTAGSLTLAAEEPA